MGFSSATELRDSLFRTEVFDLHPSEHVDYFRAIYNQCCDCAITAVQNPGFHMNYTVELVHDATSSIDTIEVLNYSPGNGQYVQDRVVHLNPDTLLEDVYLRIRGDIAGVSDSLYHFTDERLDGSYPSTGDTTLAFKRSITAPIPMTDGLAVLPPFPNPVVNSGFDAAVFYPAGGQITLDLSDMIGRNVIGPVQVTSNGAWQRVSLPAPAASGSYLLRVKAGNDEKTCVIIVNR
jgi:hypothetical protein